MEEVVVIIGAGPAGLATSACLNHLNIPNLVLEREDCYASLWRKRAYDRLKLHLGKQFCELPHLSFPSDAPIFMPKNEFIAYLDNYVSRFDIKIRYHRYVESAFYDETAKKWCVEAENTELNVKEVYFVKFLVVATGENNQGLIPEVVGLNSFAGKWMHSNKYENGKEFAGKDVLVVGCGNSGMEIGYDLASYGANVSIVARSPVHIVTKEIVFLAMRLLEYLPCRFVDSIVLMLSDLKFGDLSKYGLKKPKEGPFYLKALTGRSPTIDVGAMEKIKSKQIQVLPSITSINRKEIKFENGKINEYDAIIFATGYISTVRKWFKGGNDLFNDNGMPKQRFPSHWKGENGIYCAGFSSRGLMGISNDARNIANHINLALSQNS
ncbi:probable indole-3-pyruvate monooxygenase YUCCA11 [Ricinus communis]|uniref:probable indole-3-pyruvate monooxygenase YUCCA11 n=1 Tax=Ricinus communis TaxID=3988 RepID=UPI00201A4F48|nr:probable indole-3-pyruvate monooxygenase YUCCA11 [Ricinus communis]